MHYAAGAGDSVETTTVAAVSGLLLEGKRVSTANAWSSCGSTEPSKSHPSCSPSSCWERKRGELLETEPVGGVVKIIIKPSNSIILERLG